MTAFGSRDFRRLWLAGLISGTGDWMLLVALPVLVYQRTGSSLGTSVAFLIELIPAVLIAPLAGRLADRRDHRTLLVAVSLGQAAALLPLLAGAHLPVLYSVIAIQAALAGLFDPAKNALLPRMVAEDQLVAANSLTGLNENLGRLVGAALGGAALMAGGLPVIVIGDAASFLLSAALIWGVRPVGAEDPARDASPPRAGGHPFARRPVRAGLAVTAITAIGQGLFMVLFVVFVARNLHGNAAENGLLRAVQAIGAIAGGLVLARAARLRPRHLTGLACLAFGTVAVLMWNLPHVTTAEPVYAALFICSGIPGVALLSGLISWLQEGTADGERGRVFAAFGAVFALGEAVGMLAAGILGDRLGAVPLLNVQAICYLAGGVAALAAMARPDGPTRPDCPDDRAEAAGAANTSPPPGGG